MWIMETSSLARWLIFIGFGVVALGLLVWLFGKMGIAFGKLPGDIHVQKEKFSIYFPIVTSIVLSILLTLLINFILWILRK
jgi:hypothetical protein